MDFGDHFAHPSGGAGAIEVRCRFDNRWTRGFEIARVVIGESGIVGYVVRRTSDGSELPEVFPADEVRDSGSRVFR